MNSISIDIETFSSANLQKCGVYRYAESDDFEILLFGYSVDGGAVQVVDLACGEKIPNEIINALMDNSVTKWAFNAMFERVCLSKWLNLTDYLDPTSWKCSMVWSAYMGLPLSLEGVGAVLGLEKQILNQTEDEFVICQNTILINGSDLKHITSVMWKLRCQYSRDYLNSRFQRIYGQNIILTRKSMIVVSLLTWLL